MSWDQFQFIINQLNWCRRRDGVTLLSCPALFLGWSCNWKSANKNMIGFSNQFVSPSVKTFFKTFFPPYLAELKLKYSMMTSDLCTYLYYKHFNNVWATISTQTFLQLLFAFTGCSGQFLQFNSICLLSLCGQRWFCDIEVCAPRGTEVKGHGKKRPPRSWMSMKVVRCMIYSSIDSQKQLNELNRKVLNRLRMMRFSKKIYLTFRSNDPCTLPL